jgi:hypothetical protein
MHILALSRYILALVRTQIATSGKKVETDGLSWPPTLDTLKVRIGELEEAPLWPWGPGRRMSCVQICIESTSKVGTRV